MAELVDKAEDLGFVARHPDSGDGRAKIVTFMEAGLHVLAERRMVTGSGAAFVAELRAQPAAYVADAGASPLPRKAAPTVCNSPQSSE